MHLSKTEPPKTDTLPEKTQLLKAVQLENALYPIDAISPGIVIDARFLQLENAYFPKLLTLPGIVTVVSLGQLEKALSPIDTLFPRMVTDFKLLHSLNAPSSMLLTLPGMVISVRLSQCLHVSGSILVTPSGIVSADMHVQ